MGQTSMANITIEFVGNTPKEFKTENKLKKALLSFYRNKMEGVDANIEIYDFICNNGGVEFQFYSEKIKNMEFQVELLIDYIKSNHIEIESFSSAGYTATDRGTYYFDEDDSIDDFELEL